MKVLDNTDQNFHNENLTFGEQNTELPKLSDEFLSLTNENLSFGENFNSL